MNHRPSRVCVLALLGLLAAGSASCDGNPMELAKKERRTKLPGATNGKPVRELRELSLSLPPPEDQDEDLFAGNRYSQREMLDQISELAKDDDVRGLFLQLGSFEGAWARSVELRDALLKVRAAKKPVHCYFQETDNAGYALLARVCDRITIAPAGMLALVGVHAQVVYARDLLDTLGVRADLLQVGKFKGAADGLTRSDMPAEVRETLDALLDDLQKHLLTAVGEGRKIDAAELKRVIDAGPQSPRTALAAHLVDAVAFDDEARAHAKKAAGAEKVVRMRDRPEDEQKGLFEILRSLSGEEHETVEGQRIALAYLTGTIGNGDEDGGSGVNAGPFIRAMHRIADDAEIRALVLRVDSPGGSALASDRMWHALQRVAKRKPVVVSVGDMAASGGYYVACAGTRILAEDTSLVGSIGVVGGKFVIADLAKRAGVNIVELSRGSNSGWSSATHAFSEGEREALLVAMRETYDTFLSRVTAGRKLTAAQLAPMVEGRIMSGERARAGGLVDARGGIAAAIAEARKLATLPDDAPVERWPKKRSFVERLTHAFGGSDARALALESLRQALPLPTGSAVVDGLIAGETGAFAALPYSLTIR